MSDIKRSGLLLVLSSPSGAGKSSISRAILAEDENIMLSVSATTRPMRESEVDGVDYNFYSKDKFQSMIDKNQFIEYAKVFDNYYGTPARPVLDALDKGTDVMFDVDWQGGQILANKFTHDIVKIFILPPSIAELENRLRKRAQDSEEIIKMRMEKSEVEISHWNEYDWVIINHDFKESVEKVKSIIQSERLKKNRQSGLVDFVSNLCS
ncbi:MAG: guanylate kinase [Alphaproteobacteria bacterium]|jgi:guanylate kinase